MPGYDTLSWSEFSDFSGGLWDRQSERECPQNGLLEATDCYPQQRGGIAAFARMEPVSQTGLSFTGDGLVILGIWKLRPPFPQGKLRLAALDLNASNPGVHQFRIYSMQVGGDVTSTPRQEIATGTWNLDSAHSLVTQIDPSIKMLAYRDATLGYRVWYNAPLAQSTAVGSTISTNYTTQGVYRLGDSALAASTVSSGSSRRMRTTMFIGAGATDSNAPLWYGDLAGHQARMLVTATFDQLHNRIYMTSQGGSSGTTDFIDPLGEKAGAITWMAPAQSDYLTLAKSQIGIVVAQGDMRNAYNRQVSTSHNYMQSFPCQTDSGTFFMVQDDACYMATQGGVQSVTPNFFGTPMNPGTYASEGMDFKIANSDNQKLGQPTVAGDFLFAGNGYVMDIRTSAWFKSSFIPKAKNHTTDLQFFRMFCSTNELLTSKTQVLYHGYYLENTDASADTWNPAHTYSFTLPLTFNPHEQTQVREIVYHLDAYKPNSSITVEVYTPAGLVFERDYVIAGTGPQPVRCSGIKADGDWVKVRTTVRSDPKLPMPNEAPYIERIQVGTQKDTRTTQAARST